MLRKILSLTLFIVAFAMLSAQNLQLHFDPRGSVYGKDHFPTGNYLTATFEMFKPDKWGSTFMFVDADFNLKKGNIGLMYAEIARDFKIGDFPLMPHIEFNGGLGLFDLDNGVGGYQIQNSYLAGASYPFQLGNVFLSTYLAYKYNAFEKASHDAQWTVTWTTHLFDNKLTLTGFADLWTENKDQTKSGGDKKVVFLSEPQFWYNITNQYSIGSEVEISSNFAGANRAYVCPTLAMKWIF